MATWAIWRPTNMTQCTKKPTHCSHPNSPGCRHGNWVSLMKAVHQWDAYVTLIGRAACFCSQRYIYPLIWKSQALVSVHPSPLLIQEILMRVHMFNSRLKEVLTLFLKLGPNSALDIAAWVWHFPGKGIFTHLS